MAFPQIGADVEFWDAVVGSAPGKIEALNGTLADIRIFVDDVEERLEEGVDRETSSYHPIRGYRQAPA
jgi:hypothetical protein